jgi:O-antigen ligase
LKHDYFRASPDMLNLVAFFHVLLPWLNPLAPGPSPAVGALLFSCACATVLLWATSGAPHRWTSTQLFAVLASSWLTAGIVSCILGLLQYFDVAAGLAPWVNQAAAGEAFANLRQRNQFASLTNIGLVALIWFAGQSWTNVYILSESNISTNRLTHKNLQLLGTWFLLFCAALLSAGNAASSSRTGGVQLVLLLALSCWWDGLRIGFVGRVLLVALVSFVVFAITLPWLAGFDPAGYGILSRLRAGDEICASRLTLWSNVLHLIAQKPWFGWGWGELDYAHYMTLYGGPRFCDILDNAHNLPLHLAVELGVPVALLVCGGFVWWVWRQQPWRESDPDRQLAWSVIALILLHSMLEYPLWYGPFQMVFGFCLLILWRTRKTVAEASFFGKYALNSPFGLVTRASIATILIASLLYAAWDYHRISQIYLTPEDRDLAYRQDTLTKIRSSRLFSDQVRFAELILTPLTRDNAQWTFETARALLHFSPEPRVIEKVIESAVFLGRDDDALMQMVRYRLAFPEAYARWLPSRTLTR